MKTARFFHLVVRFFTVLILGQFVLFSCKEDIELRTVDTPLIATYLKLYPEKFSEFSALLDTTGYASFLKTFGTYTCFVPDNNAFAKLEARLGANWRSLSIAELKNIVKYHTIRDTISISSFGDGKLRTPNMYNHYLGTSSITDAFGFRLLINKQAAVIEGDIRVENGRIHVIDDVITRPAISIAKIIENMEEYSIFKDALVETGWFDFLNTISEDTSKLNWYTVFCETNEAFNKAGINGLSDLKTKFSNTGDPKLSTDGLNLFIGYHIVKGLYYAADIPMMSSYETLITNEVITSSFEADSTFLNRMQIDTIFEPGVGIIKTQSDFFSANGIMNSINGLLTIKSRKPYPIYWDVCEQPEIIKLAGTRFRNLLEGNGDIRFPNPPGKDLPVKWSKMSWTGGTTARIGYRVCDSVMSGGYPYEKNRFVHNDVMFIFNRAGSNQNAVNYVEFTTPFVPRGKYKIWLCHGMESDNREVRPCYLNIYVDDSLKKTQIPQWAVLDTAESEEDLEFLGYKRYIYEDMPCPLYNGALPKDLLNNFYDASVYVGRLIGTFDFEKHGTHRIKIMGTLDANSGDMRLDMIHIIPADMDQIWPKFNYKGEKIYKPN